MSEAKKNDAPSAEDLGAVWATLGDWDVSSSAVEAVAILLARVRREARAEAFEELATELRYRLAWRFGGDGQTIDNCTGLVTTTAQELAAKERAK